MYIFPYKSVNNVAGTKIRTVLDSLSNFASIRYIILVRIKLMMKKYFKDTRVPGHVELCRLVPEIGGSYFIFPNLVLTLKGGDAF